MKMRTSHSVLRIAGENPPQTVLEQINDAWDRKAARRQAVSYYAGAAFVWGCGIATGVLLGFFVWGLA